MPVDHKGRVTSLIGVVASVTALLSAMPASAQSPGEGLGTPDRSVATTERAPAIDTNPAGLASMREVELGVGYRAPTDDLRGVTDEGYGAYLGAGVGYLGFGLSAQKLKRPELGGERQDFTRLSAGFAGAVPFGRVAKLALGASFHGFESADNERLDAAQSVQLGAQMRFGEYLAAGFNVIDVNRPFVYEGVALPARYESTLAMRFWDGRILLDAGVRNFSGSPEIDILTRLAVEPIDGLRLFAASEFGVVDETDEVSGSWDTLRAGAELSLGTTGFEFGTDFERAGASDQPSLAAFSGYVWASSSPKKRALFDGLDRWINYDLNVAVTEGQPTGLFAPTTRSFTEIVTDFEAMSNDESVNGVFVKVGSVGLGYAQAWEVRKAIQKLRDNGKKVVAYMNGGALRDYYIASAADEVWATPATTFDPGGLRTQFITAAGALQKAGIEAQFVRLGDFKTAPELFVREEPSKSSIEQRQAYLNDFYEVVVEGISKGRGLERSEVTGLLEAGSLLPTEAVDDGFIDRIVYRDELDRVFEEFNQGTAQFERGYDRPRTLEAYWRARPEIAVVIVEGTIVQSSGGGSPLSSQVLAGADRLEPTLNRLADDPAVKAIVVRVDSPGGSAFASDVIYRALRRAALKKPIVASMGNSAASGGYYIAAGADTIVASPTTVTGSIGVFSGKFNVQRLATKLGVNIESMQKGRSIRYDDVFESWTEEELETVAKSVRYLYQLFLTQASATRPLDADELDKVARGRVWTGRAAAKRKLVDEEGGILEAIRIAEVKAGLEPGEGDYRIYPESTFVAGITDSEARQTLARVGVTFDSRKPTSDPYTVLNMLITEFERYLLMPLLYASGEPMMLPFEMPVMR